MKNVDITDRNISGLKIQFCHWKLIDCVTLRFAWSSEFLNTIVDKMIDGMKWWRKASLVMNKADADEKLQGVSEYWWKY